MIYITRQRYNSWRICALDRSNIYQIRAQKKRGLFMKYLKQFLIILVISLVGELMNKFIPLPVPASIYGMVILFAGLLTGLIKLDAVKEAGRFLIEIMPVMFIPAGVGLISSWLNLKPILVPICIITVATIFTVMGVSGHVTQFIVRRTKKGDNNEEFFS